MNRIGLIISREYFTRVKKKSFLIMTILTPLLFAGMMSLIVWLSVTQKDETEKQIVVIDEAGLAQNALKDKNHVTFIFLDVPFETAKKNIDTHYALLHITGNLMSDSTRLQLFSKKQVHSDVQNLIKNQLNRFIRDQKMAAYPYINLAKIVKELDTNVKIDMVKVGNNGTEKKSSFEIVMVIGMMAGFMIYMFIFIYGAQVMRGVIEEKTGRIIEIIVSSVKPFQLMMGKIIGLALVGLTQFLLWIILSSILMLVLNLTIGGAMPQETNASAASEIMSALGSINIAEIIGYFIIYFLGGYLLYSAMFAAIGAAVDNETDTQQFMLPVTLPLIFALYVGFSVVNNPHGPFAFWCSIIPFTSPIVMMVRIPFEVPLWEKLLSVGMLILGFLVMTYFASKIYRIGILIYGKKINYRELWKWLRY